jgi:uncharacterized protein YqeY
MSIIEKVRGELLEARKELKTYKDQFGKINQAAHEKAALLSVLVGEVENRCATAGDEIVSNVVRKLLKAAEDTENIVKGKSDKTEKDHQTINQAQHEQRILKSFLPAMISEEKIKEEIDNLVKSGTTKMSEVMSYLKGKFGNSFSAKEASKYAKEVTSDQAKK